MAEAKIIWQISDGKRGHENQSAGLIDALSQHLDVKTVKIDLAEHKASWLHAFKGQFPFAKEQSKPDLIIGTGSRTHSTILAAGRATDTPTIVIMAPPRGLTKLFDLCIVPEHDNRKGANILTTKGAMNRIRPSDTKDLSSGLFLVGGPSQHHDWDETKLLEQINTILDTEEATKWTLTTSRRTPESTTTKLQAIDHPRLTVIPVDNTSETWLPETLATASLVWATEDSVSMVYEALSSGAKVGLLLGIRKTGKSRVLTGLDGLIKEAYLLPFTAAQADLNEFKNPPALNEAERIAKYLAARYFQ
ncbi:MAG: mitochondrial fission ELM1 family protein [Opitutaceae bacterium]